MQDRSPRFPNKLIVTGVFFVLVGGVLLLWTAGFLQRFASLWPLALVLAGLVLLYFSVFRGARYYYVFLGTSLLLAGLLFLLTTTAVPVELVRIWPLFMTVIGVALLLYGFRKRGGSRLSFTVPGGAMVLLSMLFLPFSLDLVTAEFDAFVGVWWPLMFVIVGVVLMATHAGRGRGR